MILFLGVLLIVIGVIDCLASDVLIEAPILGDLFVAIGTLLVVYEVVG